MGGGGGGQFGGQGNVGGVGEKGQGCRVILNRAQYNEQTEIVAITPIEHAPSQCHLAANPQVFLEVSLPADNPEIPVEVPDNP